MSRVHHYDLPVAQWDRFLFFMATTRGMRAHQVAEVIGKLTPGIDWTGCSKSDMAREFARTDVSAFEQISELTKDALTTAVASRKAKVNATKPTLDQVHAFLLGKAAIDGFWFGDVPHGKSRFWWRTHLYEALAETNKKDK
jgi:hypothetical protein